MNQNEPYEFTKLYDEVLKVHSVKTPEGSTEILTLNTKVIWCYMYRKYDFYGKLGNDFHENLVDMSNNLGIPLSTFKRSLRILVDIGAIKIYKFRTQGFIESNRYVVKHPVYFCKQQNILNKHIPEQDLGEPF